MISNVKVLVSTLILTCLWMTCLGQQFEEQDGVVSVEAEHFTSQSHSQTRMWYIINEKIQPRLTLDADSSHHENASGNAYLEILPDTRKNHSEELIRGVNFSNRPGRLGFLHYKVHFNNPGKYYVWVRAYSTGTEDNGIHVGIDGAWPPNGQRMQWCGDKNQWQWESRQRTEEQHCGVAKQIFIEVDEPGWHTISFSMREDGFEFDKWVMTQSYIKPEGTGPSETICQE